MVKPLIVNILISPTPRKTKQDGSMCRLSKDCCWFCGGICPTKLQTTNTVPKSLVISHLQWWSILGANAVTKPLVSSPPLYIAWFSGCTAKVHEKPAGFLGQPHTWPLLFPSLVGEPPQVPTFPSRPAISPPVPTETDLQVSNQTTLSPPSFDWCFTQENLKIKKSLWIPGFLFPAYLTSTFDRWPPPSLSALRPSHISRLVSKARILGSPGSGWNRWVIWFWLLDQISRAGILISNIP